MRILTVRTKIIIIYVCSGRVENKQETNIQNKKLPKMKDTQTKSAEKREIRYI